jgi:predicted nuclease of predicted toxin-antitoxin system
MKFIVDENISHHTIKFLNELGYDVKGVPEHLKGSDDETIVNLAIE